MWGSMSYVEDVIDKTKWKRKLQNYSSNLPNEQHYDRMGSCPEEFHFVHQMAPQLDDLVNMETARGSFRLIENLRKR